MSILFLILVSQFSRGFGIPAIRRAAKAEGYKESSDGVFCSDRVTTLEEFGDSLSKMTWVATLPFYSCYNSCSRSDYFLWLGKCISECSEAGAPVTFAEYCAGADKRQ